MGNRLGVVPARLRYSGPPPFAQSDSGKVLDSVKHGAYRATGISGQKPRHRVDFVRCLYNGFRQKGCVLFRGWDAIEYSEVFHLNRLVCLGRNCLRQSPTSSGCAPPQPQTAPPRILEAPLIRLAISAHPKLIIPHGSRRNRQAGRSPSHYGRPAIGLSRPKSGQNQEINQRKRCQMARQQPSQIASNPNHARPRQTRPPTQQKGNKQVYQLPIRHPDQMPLLPLPTPKPIPRPHHPDIQVRPTRPKQPNPMLQIVQLIQGQQRLATPTQIHQ